MRIWRMSLLEWKHNKMSDENKEAFNIVQSLLEDLTEEDAKILIERLKKEREEDESNNG
jgi:hypothetical protein